MAQYKAVQNKKPFTESAMLGQGTPTEAVLAKQHNVGVSEIKQQLSRGIKVELEHTDDRKIAREIALDHLGEKLYYYDMLKKAGLEEAEQYPVSQLQEAKKRRAKTIIDGMIKSLIKQGRTHDEAIADLKKQVDSRFYEAIDALANGDTLEENLRDWFKQKWVRFGPDGKIRGDCARGSDSEGKPKCLPQSKAHALGKNKRATAARRKRREDPNPERHGKATNVRTKESVSEDTTLSAATRRMQRMLNDRFGANLDIDGQLGPLTLASINQFMPTADFGLADDPSKTTAVQGSRSKTDEACWTGYHREGNKRKAGRTVPNCVANEDAAESAEICPHCGGAMYEASQISEKQDACYYKVKSRYKVWPSAYASGALVQCRKKGAKNWGKSKTKESVQQELGIIGGKDMLVLFKKMHHEHGYNQQMEQWIAEHSWTLDTIEPDQLQDMYNDDEDADPFDRVVWLDDAVVTKYERILGAGQLVNPIIMGPSRTVIDGNHRAQAAKKLGVSIPGYVPVKKSIEESKVKPSAKYLKLADALEDYANKNISHAEPGFGDFMYHAELIRKGHPDIHKQDFNTVQQKYRKIMSDMIKQHFIEQHVTETLANNKAYTIKNLSLGMAHNIRMSEGIYYGRDMLNEQQIYEGFMSSAAQFLGNAVNNKISDIKGNIADMKSAGILIKDIVSDPKLLEVTVSQLGKQINNILKTLKQGVAQIAAKFGNNAVTQKINAVWEFIQKQVQNFASTTGWKGFLSRLGIYGFLSFIKEKIFSLTDDILATVKSGIFDTLADNVLELGKIMANITMPGFLGFFGQLVTVKKYFFDVLTYIKNKIDSVRVIPSESTRPFKKYNTQITETFDQPYPWTWTSSGKNRGLWIAQFNDVEVLIDLKTAGLWDMSFDRNGSMTATGQGDQFKIFATVIDIAKDFVLQMQPERFSFYSHKDPDETTSSRPKLYSALIKRFAGSLGYDSREKTSNDFVFYTLTRQKQAQFVTETFDQPYPWKWSDHDIRQRMWTASFADVVVIFSVDGAGEWGVSFNRDGSQAVTGEGDQFKIFATVLDIAKDFINLKRPKSIQFTAHKEETETTSSRTKLYSAMVKRFANSLGYDSQEKPFNDFVVYVLTKKQDESVAENFADGKGPGRPGDSQRHGIPKHATLAQLDKIAHQGGRKGQLAHWQANMRRGRAKTNEATPAHGDNRNEAAMMLAGTKPAALINELEFEKLYAPHMAEHNWIAKKFWLPDMEHNFYVIGQPGELDRVKRIGQLVYNMNKSKQPPDAKYHTELGRLLGYSEADIEDFLVS